MKKVLIIDDSALMRRLMSDIIKEDNGLEVSDMAKNGEEGLALLDEGRQYDLILLDINMPKMNGVVFLEHLLERGLTTKVIIVSSIASRSTHETIRALELGAFDFIKKPGSSSGKTTDEFKYQLLSKSYLAVGLERGFEKVDWKNYLGKNSVPNTSVSKVDKKAKGTLVFIACSTGGPQSLQQVIPKFPKDFPCPILVVQHMPAGFTRSLADRLNEMSSLSVMETSDGQKVEPGHVYLAKGGHQSYLVQDNALGHELRVTTDPPRNALRPCADVLLESLAETGYRRIICAVLTGMGDDGTRGLAYLRQYKEITVIGQDEKTSVVYGMPKAAKMAGLVDEIVALQDVAGAIMDKVKEIPV